MGNAKTVAIIILLLVLATGASLGLYFGLQTQSSRSAAASSDGSSPSTPAASAPTTTDPSSNRTVSSSFTLDPRLTKSFWGLNYVSTKVQLPWCGTTQEEVTEDIKLISQVTGRVKLYGMDCGQADMVFEAIKTLNVSLGVVLTVWVDTNMTTYQRQLDKFWNITRTYGFSNIIGVSVGNEAIFRNEVTLTDLTNRISQMRQNLTNAGHKEIPVFTTEINNFDVLIRTEDVLCDNIHPFFGNVAATQAASWTWEQFDGKNMAISQPAGKPSLIAETGWPTAAGGLTRTGAIPSMANLQVFLDTFVCEANRRNLPYYYFEFMDSIWKPDDDTERYWGLFYANRTLKPLTLPNCTLPAWTVGDLSIPQPARLRT